MFYQGSLANIYLHWTWLDPSFPKHPKEDRDLQPCRGYLSKLGHVDILNRTQLALFDCPNWSFFRNFFLSCKVNTRVQHTQMEHGLHSLQLGGCTYLFDFRRQSNLKHESGFKSQTVFRPKLCPPVKTYCLLSNGPQFVHVVVLNYDQKLISVSVIPVTD